MAEVEAAGVSKPPSANEKASPTMQVIRLLEQAISRRVLRCTETKCYA
jgi:hypothetical protein